VGLGDPIFQKRDMGRPALGLTCPHDFTLGNNNEDFSQMIENNDPADQIVSVL
jgi:hypothetical protein